MPKRARAHSESASHPPKRLHTGSSDCAPSLVLTEDNLARLQESLTMPRRTPSPKRVNNNLDQRDKLEAYRISVDKERVLPPALAELLHTAIRKPRDPDVIPSPNAKEIVRRRRRTAVQPERNGLDQLAPYLLPVGEVDGDCRVAAERLINTKKDITLHRFFLPPAPQQDIVTTWKELSQPQPDLCTGYVTRREAASAVQPYDPAFTADEEQILYSYPLSQYLHFPFLTAQFKAPSANENLRHAQNQAARDGDVAVNYIYEMYSAAYSESPCVADTCHFSYTCDLDIGELWVHWREGLEHYMELVLQVRLRNHEEMLDLRSHLRNIVHWARESRLQSIKAALPHFAASKLRGNFPTVPASESSASISVSDMSSQSTQNGLLPVQSNFVINACLLPRSICSEPTERAKRKI
jgi:hypothetical protein